MRSYTIYLTPCWPPLLTPHHWLDVDSGGIRDTRLQSSRHFFLSWELSARSSGKTLGPGEQFCRLYNGGEYSRFLQRHCEIVRFGFYGSLRPEDITDYTFVLRNKTEHFKPGVAFVVRGNYLDAHLSASEFLFTVEGQVIPIEDEELQYFVLGYLNSTVASRLLNCFLRPTQVFRLRESNPCPTHCWRQEKKYRYSPAKLVK